jgi:transcription elongation factor Elf1
MSTLNVHANCPSCGPVPVASADVVVRVCVDHQSSSYAFRCPACGLRAAVEANERIVEVLTAAGAYFDVWYLPDELRETRPGGAPLTEEDLLDFQLLLERQDWFERLTELGPRPAPQGRANRRSRSRWTPWSRRMTEPPAEDGER